MNRRRFLIGLMGVTTLSLGYRWLGGYPMLSGWSGRLLSSRQAWILMAAGEALIPSSVPGQSIRMAANIDRYLQSLPADTAGDIALMLAVVEHSPLLNFQVRRFSHMEPQQQLNHLEFLGRQKNKLALCYRGLRDLCMMGHYQVESTWKAIGYPGPWLRRIPAAPSEKYLSFLAPAGQKPKAWLV